MIIASYGYRSGRGSGVYRTGLRASKAIFKQLDKQYDRVCGGIVRMMDASEKWCGPTDPTQEPSVLYDTE